MISSRRRFIKIAATNSAAFALASQTRLFSALPSATLRKWEGIVLGAQATIQLNCESENKAERVLKSCVSEIQRLENIFSLYDERSSLSLLNRSKRLSSAPTELVELLRYAQSFGQSTRGIFDVTIQPVITAYREHFEANESGLPLNLKEALHAVDYRHIKINRRDIELSHPQATVTLNGVAQGYITDKIAELLRGEGFGHTLIDLGEKRALDNHPSGRDWQLGLANGFGLHEVAELNNNALSSSGGYGTSFDSTGKHHHLIDPRTGLSVNHHASVHVIAKTATLADALSTTLATCSREEAKEIEQSFPEARVARS
ncbi:FAD:protein FMN transferase [Pelagicoccus sp. SDUM812002]|uniref:FAD:protein FMN transferase n=1 Tax=Pelagicoccus sp. SDUM812002 TaxID=3041266 RepID=UPI00280E9A41|nr:FAD:protein FMN transferase [Pelagicoccus sp. SDUM812002]MDQ8186612.1 FAD:protein FMN transferase [Pelagicoccus sp. SDUM812002]